MIREGAQADRGDHMVDSVGTGDRVFDRERVLEPRSPALPGAASRACGNKRTSSQGCGRKIRIAASPDRTLAGRDEEPVESGHKQRGALD
jgi:hypothetical protein